VSRLRAAAQAHWVRMSASQTSPLVVLPEWRLPPRCCCPVPSRPTRPGGRETGHVGADLGDDRLRGPLSDAGDGVEVVAGFSERGHHLVDLGVEVGGGGLEVGVWSKTRRMSRAWCSLNRPRSGLAQLRDLLAQPSLGQLRQSSGSRSPATRAASMARPETPSTSEPTESNLMPGVLEGLLDPLTLRGVGLDEAFAIPTLLVPQLTDGSGRDEAAPQQAVLDQLGQPLGVRDVALAARQDLDVAGVGCRRQSIDRCRPPAN